MTQPILFAVEDGEYSPVTEGAAEWPLSLNRSDKGDVSELAFELEARRRGWIVCTPRGNTRGFDCVVLRPESVPVLVQIKAGTWIAEKSFYQFNNSKAGQIYSEAAYDIMAVHLVREDRWVFFSRPEMGNRLYGRYSVSDAENFFPRKHPSLCGAPVDNWDRIDEVASSKIISGAYPPTCPTPQPITPAFP